MVCYLKNHAVPLLVVARQMPSLPSPLKLLRKAKLRKPPVQPRTTDSTLSQAASALADDVEVSKATKLQSVWRGKTIRSRAAAEIKWLGDKATSLQAAYSLNFARFENVTLYGFLETLANQTLVRVLNDRNALAGALAEATSGLSENLFRVLRNASLSLSPVKFSPVKIPSPMSTPKSTAGHTAMASK